MELAISRASNLRERRINAPATGTEAAVTIAGLAHSYGSRQAIAPLDLRIDSGHIFSILGPNGGGKTTLFRVLSTLIPLQRGKVQVFGFDLARQQAEIRALIGVVFQAPSLDRKLTVSENIAQHAALYGLFGAEFRRRRDELLEQFGLRDRAGESVERLSGGLRRRTELAKGLIHRPRLLLLDEPSTGLDPAARNDLRQHLAALRDNADVTVVLTTHYLEEADAADRVAILHEGRLVALGRPDDLRAEVGGDAITIETGDAPAVAAHVREVFALEARVIDNAVRIEAAEGHLWVARLAEGLKGRFSSIRLGKPTLEDVFIARTGHRFWAGDSDESALGVGR